MAADYSYFLVVLKIMDFSWFCRCMVCIDFGLEDEIDTMFFALQK